MSSVWGRNLKISVFGESHGAAIGVTIDGLPPGFEVDYAVIEEELRRRAPGNSATSTPRKEADAFEILSGVFNGRLTGAPLTAICRNTNTRSSDYEPEIPRPGHADVTAKLRYEGYNDYRGGGHFSGRLTAPLVFAGAIGKQILKARYGTVITAARDVSDEEILAAKADGDSIGGLVECRAVSIPPGIGEPMFGGVESVVSSMLFSIPAVKGVEFGDGFKLASMRGSEANDEMEFEGEKLRYLSNHNGGVLGGITTGEPLVVRAAIKPTPSISKPQKTVNLSTGENLVHSFGGRHDPSIVPRAVPVIEAAVAIALLDLTINHLKG